MPKRKLRNQEELDTFTNVFQRTAANSIQIHNCKGEIVDLKGKWHQEVFKNENAIVLELACGKGDYTIALARRFPEQNFIGIDIKGPRMWRGAKTALEEGLNNVAFLRIQIARINLFFEANEVSGIWITFPDPFLKIRQHKNRLTAPGFLEMYKKICAPEAVIHLKTDNTPLFNYTLETLNKTGCTIHDVVNDVYKEQPDNDLLTIKTFYEKQHLEAGLTIKYLSFQFPHTNGGLSGL